MGPASKTSHKASRGRPGVGARLRCVLCCNIANVDGRVDEFRQIVTAEEKECFAVLLRLLEISADPFLSIPDDWSDNDFTFCFDCGECVKRGLLLNEEIQALQLQQKLVKKKVLGLLEEGIQLKNREVVQGSVKARNILRQCYQRCEVNLSDDAENDDIPADTFLLVPKEEQPPETDLPPELQGRVAVSEELESPEFDEAFTPPSLPPFDDWDAPFTTGGRKNSWRTENAGKRKASKKTSDQTVRKTSTLLNKQLGKNKQSFETKELSSPTLPDLHSVASTVRRSVRVSKSLGTTKTNSKISKSKPGTPSEALINEHFPGELEELRHSKRTTNSLEAMRKRKFLADHPHLQVDAYKNSRSRKVGSICDDNVSLTTQEYYSASEVSVLISDLKSPATTSAPRLLDRGASSKSQRKMLGNLDVPVTIFWSQTNGKVWQCGICPFFYLERDELQSHFFDAHSLLCYHGCLVCNNCGSVYVIQDLVGQKEFYDQHYKCSPRDSNGAQNCLECTRKFDSVEDKVSHYLLVHFTPMQSHKEDSAKRKIEQVSESSRKKRNTIPVTTSRANTKLKCAFCKEVYSFENKHDFRAHVRQTHRFIYHKIYGQPDEEGYACENCGCIYPASGSDQKSAKSFVEEHSMCVEEIGLMFNPSRFAHPSYEAPADVVDSIVSFAEEDLNADADNDQEKDGNSCVICGSVLQTPDEVSLHWRMHGFRWICGYLTCSNCGDIRCPDETISIKEFTLLHAECCAPGENVTDYPCSKCDKVCFSVRAKVLHFDKEHRASLTNLKKACPLCQFNVSENEEAYEYHLKARHGLSYRKNMYGCRQCGQVYNKVNHRGLRNFVDKHSRCQRGDWMKKSYKCHLCDRRLFGFSFMVDHLTDHSEKGDTAAESAEVAKEADEHLDSLTPSQFEANTCDLSGPRTRATTARRKKSSSTANSGNPLKHLTMNCPVCSVKLPSPRISNAFRDHILQVHKLTYYDGLIGCRNCGDIHLPDLKMTLKQFENTHSNCTRNERGKLECRICKHKSSSFLQKIAHYKTKHCRPDRGIRFVDTGAVDIFPNTSSSQPHRKEKCAFCPMIFDKTTKDQLPEHVMSLHKISYFDRVYGCGICGVLYSAELKCGIEKFRVEHECCVPSSNQVELKCKKCSTVTETFAQLVSHSKTAHPANSYWCFICGKEYTSHFLVKIHCAKSHLELLNPEDVSSGENLVIEIPKETELNCDLCNVKFSLSERFSYNHHMKFWHNLKPLEGAISCVSCGSVYIKKEDTLLEDFQAKHANCFPSENRKFICEECGKELTNLNVMNRHVVTMHLKVMNYACGICGKHFEGYRNIAHHLMVQHDKIVPFKSRETIVKSSPDAQVVCPCCPHSENSMSSLGYHFLRYHDNRSFRCRDCGTKLTSLQEVKHHFQTAHTEDHESVSDSRLVLLDEESGRELPVLHDKHSAQKCMLCEVDLTLFDAPHHYSDSHSLLSIMGFFGCLGCSTVYGDIFGQRLADFVAAHATCPDRPQRSKQCKLCNSKFPFFSHLIKHYQREHKKFIFHCKQCGKGYRGYNEYVKHRLFHANPELKRNYKCPHCSLTFVTISSLGIHARSHPEAVGTVYRCKTCLQECSSEKELLKHSKTHLEDIQNNRVCGECGKPTPTIEEYETHQSVHRNYKPSAKPKKTLLCCTICKAEFTNIADYRLHRKRIHNEDIVNAVDVRPTSHHRHMEEDNNSAKVSRRKHQPLPEKKLSTTCELCKKKFKFRRGYWVHMHKVHLVPAFSMQRNISKKLEQARLKRRNYLRKLRETFETPESSQDTQEPVAAVDNFITVQSENESPKVNIKKRNPSPLKKQVEAQKKQKPPSKPKTNRKFTGPKKPEPKAKPSSSPKRNRKFTGPKKPEQIKAKPSSSSKLSQNVTAPKQKVQSKPKPSSKSKTKKTQKFKSTCTVCNRSYLGRKAFMHHVYLYHTGDSPETTSPKKTEGVSRNSVENLDQDTTTERPIIISEQQTESAMQSLESELVTDPVSSTQYHSQDSEQPEIEPESLDDMPTGTEAEIAEMEIVSEDPYDGFVPEPANTVTISFEDLIEILES